MISTKPIQAQFLFSLLLFFSINGLNAEAKEKVVWPEMVSSVEIFEDNLGLSFDSLQLSGKRVFHDYLGESLKRNQVYWLRIRLDNSLAKHTDYLIYFNLSIYFDWLELYQIDKHNNVIKSIGGPLVPYKQRTLKSRSKLPFFISPKDETELYIRFYTKLANDYNLSQVNIVSIEKDKALGKRYDLMFTFLGGMMFIIILLNVWLYISKRDRLYLFYSLYVIVTLIYFLYVHGITEQFLFNQHPQINLVLFYFLTLAQAMYFWFFYELIKHEKIPKWSSAVYYYVCFISVLWAVIFVTSFLNRLVANIICDVYSGINIVFIIVIIVLLFGKVSKVTRIVMLGVFVWSSVGTVELMLIFFQGNRETLTLYYSAIFVEMLMFSVAINYMYFTDRIEKQKLILAYSKLQLNKSEVDDEYRKISEQLELKNREVVSKEILIAQKQNLLDSVSKDLIEIQKKDDHIQNIQRLVQSIQINRKSENWKEFELHFNKIHPRFYIELVDLCPNLSNTDIKLCAFIKLQMTTKQIASITGKSINSIDVSRSRLRKKLGLKNGSLTSTLVLIGN